MSSVDMVCELDPLPASDFEFEGPQTLSVSGKHGASCTGPRAVHQSEIKHGNNVSAVDVGAPEDALQNGI